MSKTFLQNLHIPKFIIDGMNIYGKYYHPTFFYESLWAFIGFIILLLYRNYRYLKIGELTVLYLMWYSLGRFFIETLRTDSLMWGNFRVAQLVSVVLFAIGLIIFIVCRKGARFSNLYNEGNKTNEIKF